ncbi:MAG TPA: hypothetical protein VK530_20195 [Candidatus Acidoferrum sp.]|nr:hypothetical protein [Candidatus Acidoferrum sp.]
MDPSHLCEDFRDFLKCLNDAGVEYMLVGGHAVAYHGYVRPTRDMDVRVAVTPENAERLVSAVKTFFGTELAGLKKEWFLDPEHVTHFGAFPNLIEILGKVSGREFRDAFTRCVKVVLDGQSANLISFDDLLANKRASGRLKDKVDVEELTKDR